MAERGEEESAELVRKDVTLSERRRDDLHPGIETVVAAARPEAERGAALCGTLQVMTRLSAQLPRRVVEA